jgi:hypothetical protein
MRLPRQLINLIGALVVIAVLAAGVLIGAMPLYMESARTTSDADRAANDNGIFRAELEGLQTQSANFAELEADVDALRAAIPATPQLDDVFEIIAKAAAETDMTVTTITTDDPQTWSAQVGPLDTAAIEALAADAPAADESASTESAPADATESGTATDGAATDTAADGTGAATGTEADADSPQQSIAITITAKTADPASIFRFIDLLSSGERLVSIVHTELDGDSEDTRLIVNAMTFVRTES